MNLLPWPGELSTATVPWCASINVFTIDKLASNGIGVSDDPVGEAISPAVHTALSEGALVSQITATRDTSRHARKHAGDERRQIAIEAVALNDVRLQPLQRLGQAHDPTRKAGRSKCPDVERQR